VVGSNVNANAGSRESVAVCCLDFLCFVGEMEASFEVPLAGSECRRFVSNGRLVVLSTIPD
jgi:hypothetical protein